jgi:hypothetical protein
LSRLGGVVSALAAATLLLAPGAAADHSVIEWVSHGAPPGEPVGVGYPGQASADGSSVVYEADGRLVPQDADSSADVYKWTNGVNELLSIGPDGGNAEVDVHPYNLWATPDVSHVYFITEEGLVHNDTDGANDLYERAGGVTTLLTNGSDPGDGRGPYQATPVVNYVTPDGGHVFFTTAESLVPQDDDVDRDTSAWDGYERFQGETRLVTAYPDGRDACCGGFAGTTADGSRAWFTSTLPLVPEDQDGFQSDVYERSGGTTTLVSHGTAKYTTFGGASADGSRIFIKTEDQLAPNDPDPAADVYELTPSGPVLITTGPADDSTGKSVRVEYVSPDGSRVLFATAERLFADLPTGEYLYERSGGTTKVISGPPLAGGAPVCNIGHPLENDYCSYLGEVAGGKIFYNTTARLVPEDTDSNYDAYVYSGGVNRLVGGPNAWFIGASSDGTRAFVGTPDPVVPADTDTLDDVYENHNGMLSLVTYDPSADPWGASTISPTAGAVADDGDVFFTTSAAVAGAPGGSTNLFVARVADQTGYPRPKAAGAAKFSLVPAYQSCANPNRTHGPPLAFPSCAPPLREPGRLTVGTPDANGQPPKSSGYVLLRTVLGDPSTPADEADVSIELLDQDVRKAADLSDYTGEVSVSLGLRITQRDGPTPAGGGPAPVTQQDLDFAITVPCAATAETTVGATCATTTSADAVLPGAISEQRRTIWALNQVRVLDGGPDGDADTSADNQIFQAQGVFIP